MTFSQMCEYALIAEVSATPKPGLVDRHDNGAHRDMCLDTFVASTGAIVPYLFRMWEMGITWDGDGRDLFAAIRPVGVDAERAMFLATGGVNTHKGIIFSMGLTAAVSGWYYHNYHTYNAEEILTLAGRFCRDLLEKDFSRINPKQPRTHGEILFVRYGSRGIRGEAQKGFPSIRSISLPLLRQFKQAGMDDNTAHLNTLLALMAHVEDTNVLIRTNPALLTYEKAAASRILKLGGASTPEGMEALKKCNEDFIRLNISPGGCADLLAVTILLWELENMPSDW